MATRQEIMKEIDRLNKSVEDANLRKEEALLNLGILVYQKVREGLLDNEEIDQFNKNFEKIIFLRHFTFLIILLSKIHFLKHLS